MKFLTTTAMLLALTVSAHASPSNQKPTNKSSDDDPICGKIEEVSKMMDKNNLFSLLNMTNKNGVVETVWVNSTAVVITAQVKDKDTSCVIAIMKDVIFNPDTIGGINKVYEEQKKKQKDI